VFAVLTPQISAQSNSKNDSAPDTVVVKKATIDQCGKALDELTVYDKLLESKEAEIKLLQERLQLEKEKFDLVRQVSDARANQAASLSEANTALKEAIAAKESIIANKDKEIEILKKKKTSVLTIIKTVGVGIGIGLILK
jgi:multidrug resistance efflux pump